MKYDNPKYEKKHRPDFEYNNSTYITFECNNTSYVTFECNNSAYVTLPPPYL